MALPDFRFLAPATLDEALALLAASPGSIAMGGGTDLLVQMKHGAAAPPAVVSLARVPELRGIRQEGERVVIGGGVTAAEIEANGLLPRHAPALVDAARTMATVQVRNRATIAGNLATAAACADFAPPLLAHGAQILLWNRAGERRVPAAAFLTGARRTLLGSAELIVAVELPAGVPSAGSAYRKFGYRRGAQIAVASAAAWLRLESGKVAELSLVLGSVAPVPVAVKGATALVGHAPEGEALEAACRAAAAECTPISDIRGSEAYRRAVVAVMARRAIAAAAERAGEVRS